MKMARMPDISELREEPDVVAVQVADVVDLHAFAHHHGALDAPAEGEAAPLFRIDAAGREDVRVHHAGAAELEPAFLADAAFAARGLAGAAADVAGDVDLEGGFGEAEVERAQARLAASAEELAGEVVEHALEMRDGDVLVDHQPLELVEHRGVRDVDLAAVRLGDVD